MFMSLMASSLSFPSAFQSSELVAAEALSDREGVEVEIVDEFIFVDETEVAGALDVVLGRLPDDIRETH